MKIIVYIVYRKENMKLKEIYKRAKKINPLYTNSFEDFISDFGNCRDCFFKSRQEFKKYGVNKEIDREWEYYYKKYYN